MSWFRLDDQGAFHEKVLAAGNDAYGAWCRAGQWSSGRLTEGRIPRVTALTIAKEKVWKNLVEVGLCELLENGDWQIHDYLDWNPTAEAAEAKKAARVEAGRRGGLSKAAAVARRAASETVAIASPVAKQTSTPFPFPFPYQEKETPVAPGGAAMREPPAVRAPEIADRVFAEYLRAKKLHRPTARTGRAVLTPKDRKSVAARVREGFSEETLTLAARGIFLDPWDGRAQQDAFEYVLRAANLTKFAELAELAEAPAPTALRLAPDPGPPGTPPAGVLEDMFAAIAGEKPKSALELFGPDPGSEIRFRRDAPSAPETKTSGEMK